MNSGQGGWPPGNGGPNPWAQQNAGWQSAQGGWNQGGAPAPQPELGGAPFRTPASVDSSETMEEVELPWPVSTVPNACACCSAPATASLKTQASAQIGRTTQTRTLSVPYCPRCEHHVRQGGRRGVTLGFLAFFVAVTVPLSLMQLWDYAPWFVTIPAAVGGAFGALAMLDALWRLPPVARDQGCHAGEQPAFWMFKFAFNGPTVTFRGVNPKWMEQLARSYNTRSARVGPRTPARARWIAVPICAFLAAIPLWFAFHGRVYFDNPTQTPLTFVIDGGSRELTLAPGAHDSFWLPSGQVEVVVKRAGQGLETIQGEVGHWSKHAVTPLGTACYAVIQRAYGTASVSGSAFESAPYGQRWHDLHRVQLVFEPFPRSVSVGRGQRGATRRRFTRVPCSLRNQY